MIKKHTILKAYIGTYTTGESKGIYRISLDSISGKIEEVELAGEVNNPTYLTINKYNTEVYSVIKLEEGGGVAAFSIDLTSGNLNLLNFQVSEGKPPCHVSLDKGNNYLFSSNYHKGTIEVFPINENRELCPTSSSEIHKGSTPHVHYSTLTPDEKYLCVIDLGLDKLVIYEFNKGKSIKFGEVKLKPGCGPRHMEFHPNGKFVYIITELSSEVILLEYTAINGSFKEIQYISALPTDNIIESSGGAIHISPKGEYLYTSNRGHDTIAVFSIDISTGILKLISNTPTEGKHPRDFSLDPTGRFLVVANQNSSNIATFLIDEKTGTLSLLYTPVSIPNPTCVKFTHI